MKHSRGIDLVGGKDVGYTVGDGSAGRHEHTYRIEVWTRPPEDGGQLIETISRATDYEVSIAALRAVTRRRPGKVIVHLNGRHRMSCETAPETPLPERRRSALPQCRPFQELMTERR